MLFALLGLVDTAAGKSNSLRKLSDLNLLIHQDESLPKRERKLIHDIVKLIKDEAVGENIEKVE